MKRRPVGKEDYSSRSCLHDDITVIIVRFSYPGGAGGGEAALPAVVQASTTTAEYGSMAALTAEVVQSARDVFDKLDR
jgi:hypothetical protein